MTLTDLESTLRGRIDGRGLQWLDEALDDVRNDPNHLPVRFPAAGRSVGRGPLDPQGDPEDPFAWTLDDAARAVLLGAVGDAAGTDVVDLYRHGDQAERRGVLRSLEYVDVGDAGRTLVDDALRTNDTGLVAAALGPYAIDTLDDDALAQATLKCVFMGLPVGPIAGLTERVTPDLSRMLAGYVHERVAAGRDIPDDIWPLIDRHPPVEEIAAIEGEVDSEVSDRRRAAEAALAKRQIPTA